MTNSHPSPLKAWIEAMRLRTLPVSLAGVVVACSLAAYDHSFHIFPAVICMAFALLAQIAANFGNEYFDFLRGADRKGRVGPRRGVTEGDIDPHAMRTATFVTLAVACLIGCLLIPIGGWLLIGVGVVTAIGALAYSAGPFPLSRRGLGDVAVVIFFGIIPVTMTYYLQTGAITTPVTFAGIGVGMMGANVLMVNNYRDIDDDIEAGKTTLATILRKGILEVYLVSGCVAALLFVPYYIEQPMTIIPAIIYIILHLATWRRICNTSGAALNPLLGATARNMLIFAIVFTLTALL